LNTPGGILVLMIVRCPTFMQAYAGGTGHLISMEGLIYTSVTIHRSQ